MWYEQSKHRVLFFSGNSPPLCVETVSSEVCGERTEVGGKAEEVDGEVVEVSVKGTEILCSVCSTPSSEPLECKAGSTINTLFKFIFL